MLVIKRYQNRKLYDTDAKRYVSLEGVAELVRRGAEVRVVDHATGDDVTAIVLGEIILGQERRRRGALPRSLLCRLIQGDSAAWAAISLESSREAGLLSLVDQEIQRRVQHLVNLGELAEDEALRILDKLLSADYVGPMEGWPATDDLERVLRRCDLPTRADWQRVMEQLAALAQAVESLACQAEAR